MQPVYLKSVYLYSTQQWEPTIGLEIHAQIATNSKLFSKASTKFTSPVNSSVSLFDCAIPGTMPVLNKKCVEAGVLTALALSCDLNEVSMFERKHYFYADLPAGFQITQQKKPLAVNGEISFYVFTPTVHKVPYLKTSKIQQIQLEQDSGKSLHFNDEGKSLIDLNRAGVPLMELVFEPDLRDGEEAAALVKELSTILRILGTCSCKMEEGALRVDANVSVTRQGEPLGTRTELKNIGSVRAVAAAIKYEIARQTSILNNGGEIENETRAWDAANNKTVKMREKEENLDYRFMPETNLPPLFLNTSKDAKKNPAVIDLPSLESCGSVLPGVVRDRLLTEYGMNIRLVLAIMSDLELLQLFLDIKNARPERNATALATFFMNEFLTTLHKFDLKIAFCMNKKEYIGEVFDMKAKKEINWIVTCELLALLKSNTEKTPRQLVEENNWYLLTDEEILRKVCSEVLNKNQSILQQYKRKKKKDGIFQLILHEVSMALNRRADVRTLSLVLKKVLDEL